MKHTHKLTKIQSKHNNVRTKEMLGIPFEMPRVGDCFVMHGESITLGGAYRQICTTPVVRIEGETFFTKNSQYKLEAL